MKKHSHCFIAFVMLICISGIAFGAQALAPKEVAINDYPYLPYDVSGPVLNLSKVWRYIDGDNSNYAEENFDDTSWKTLEVGKPKAGGGWRWYRTEFDLPAEFTNKNVLLDLGRVSVYGEVFVNGKQIGHFGNPPPNFIFGGSSVWRKYPIDAQHFHAGRNTLAVKVFLGYKGGLYQGSYTLQALSNNAVVSKMVLKTDGANSLELLLTESPYLNTFEPGSKLLVEPDLLKLFGAPVTGILTAKIVDANNQLIDQDAIDVPLAAMQWKRTLFQFNAPTITGDYSCRLSYSADGKVLWQKVLPFHVKPSQSLHFSPPVDATLNQQNDEKFPVDVSSSAMGHFGPRDVSADSVLFDDVDKTDARSGMAYSVHVIRSAGAPQLFLANTRPVPQDSNKVPRFHRAAGYKFDGFNDAWLYGYVRPNRAGAIEKMSIKSTSWAKRTYRYEYKNKDWMDFSISAISPAWQVNSNAQKVRVFDNIKQYGIGLPTHFAYESNGKVKVVDAKKGFHGSDMSANWVLAWFNGSEGWDGFDTPYLFVLEKRPRLVQCYAETALIFSYTDSAGLIQGMPLYGVTLQRPDQTADWANGLPDSVKQRCEYWARVLVNAPDQVKRSAKVDYAKDQLTVKDEFSYLDIHDDWKTQGIKIAPLSPVLVLSAASRNMDIEVSKPTIDLQMATLQGPLVAADNAQQMIFRISGVLHYIREVRDVKPADDAQSQQVRTELNKIVAGGLQTELKDHPWKSTVTGEKLMPGHQRVDYTNLILTLPYLDSELRSKVEQAIETETQKYFLHDGVADSQLAEKLKPELRDRPLIEVLTNPYTGLKIGMEPTSEKRFGIDQTYFSTLNIYMIWLYADTFHKYDWVKQKYPVLKDYFNIARNSHDWLICESWDTLSGLRVGNGLQEGGGIYAGMVGMARIAKELGDQTTSDEAAYYAVMQIVGLQGQLSATDYLKHRRPWLTSNTKNADIEYLLQLHPFYYAEFNEFAGLSQATIGFHNSQTSAGGFIESPLPEVMRLYQEIWPKFTNEFYDPKYDVLVKKDRRVDDRISLDAFVYQMTEYPQSVQKVFDVRKKLDLSWWEKLPDYRAYLDSRGKIGHRDLW